MFMVKTYALVRYSTSFFLPQAFLSSTVFYFYYICNRNLTHNNNKKNSKKICNLKPFICCLWLAHQWLYGCLEGNILLQFLCWTLYPTCLCALSTSFSHSICPQSAGAIPSFITYVLCFNNWFIG